MFDVAAEAYDAFMGRYSTPLAPRFCDFAGIGSERRVLDVGCGPGALITELVGRLGSAGVSAVDPSHSFVQAVRERHPDVDVRQASAEQLPFHEDEFDASLAQLVVHFMDDPFAGLQEMTRVTRSGGVVAACVWDHAGGQGPLSPFWDAARELDPEGVRDESELAGARKGHLSELLEKVGLEEVEETLVSVSVEHAHLVSREIGDLDLVFNIVIGLLDHEDELLAIGFKHRFFRHNKDSRRIADLDVQTRKHLRLEAMLLVVDPRP